MDLDFTVDQQELRDSVRKVLSAECSLEYVRSMADGDTDPQSLWKTMTSLGWPALSIPEDSGGLGLGFVELGILSEEMGRALAPDPLIPTAAHFSAAVIALGSDAQRQQLLPAIAEGDTTGALALDDLPSSRMSARPAPDGWVLDGAKRIVPGAQHADLIAVVATEDRASDAQRTARAFVVPASRLVIEPIRSADETRSFASVRADEVHIGRDSLLGADANQGTTGVAGLVDRLTVTEAAMGVGVCSAIFDIALEYAKTRYQFGVPIGSFQAIKHKLVDMYVELERARSLVYYAMLALEEDAPNQRLAAAVAKAAYGECQTFVVQQGFQLHGGIAYTWEHPLHLYLKRAQSCDSAFGNGTHHQARVGEMLRAGAHLTVPA